MIPLTLGQAVAGYTLGLVSLLLLIIVVRALWRTRLAIRDRRALIQCTLCGSIYENPAPDPLPLCPNCGRPNERSAPPGV